MTAKKSLSIIDLNTLKTINVKDPTSAQDGATKAYVDANAGSPGGAGTKTSALTATTSLDDSDVFPSVNGGTTKKTSLLQILNYVNPFKVDYTSTTPSLPSSGLIMFSRFRARRLPAFVGPSGQDTSLQPALFTNRVARISAIPSATTPSVDGISVIHLHNATATPAAVAQSTGSLFNSLGRYRCSTTATAGVGAGTRSSTSRFFMTNIQNTGGFFFVTRFGISVPQSGHRLFAGLYASTAAYPPASDPSTLTSFVGFGADAADTNLNFMYRASTGTVTKIDLGVNFPSQSGGTNFYEFRIFSPSGSGATLYWAAIRINDGALVQGGPITSGLPALDTLLSPYVHLSNGATAAVASIDIQNLYIETDN